MWTERGLRKALRLYVIPDREIGAPLSLEEQTRQVLESGATAIQLRDKRMDGGEMLSVGKRMAALCARHNALFIVNDRLDVALFAGADGVHLGQSDLPVAEVRKLVPRTFVIGASAHTPEEAKRAEAEGADYIGAGAVFNTGSKDDAKIIGLQGLGELAAATRLPVVAIGGIALDNISEVMRSGVAGISVISAAVRGDVKERTGTLLKALTS